MNLFFNTDLAKGYKSSSQISRVLTEGWVLENSYCPSCGWKYLAKYPDNRPVADFYCNNCKEDFELKSKNGILGSKVVDGSYITMIDRITSDNNPNFLFLTYNKSNWSVKNLVLIPKRFFIPDIIEKRPPLATTARRAGWVGCNIDLNKIPSLGKVFIVKDSLIINKEDVVRKWGISGFLENKGTEFKGWMFDVLQCIDSIPSKSFSIQDAYQFEHLLKSKHPENNFIKDKIRQQLQYLRDKGILEFVSKGNYRKIYL